MQLNKIMYIDLADPLPKSYAPKKGQEKNRSTYSIIRYNLAIFGMSVKLSEYLVNFRNICQT